MDGAWYQVDTTWDDMGANNKIDYYEHAYFGLTDEIMGMVHPDHKTAVPGYESVSLKNNYFIKTEKYIGGLIRSWIRLRKYCGGKDGIHTSGDGARSL